MAWTVNRINTVFGNKQARLLKVTADAATQTVETGLAVVEHIAIAFGSCTTQVGLKIFPNSGAGGTATNGVLGCSGFTAGDDVYITVFGR